MKESRKKITNVPNLRFPGFSGEWKSDKLGNKAIFSKGKGISKSDISDNGYLECIRYGQLYTVYSEVIDTIVSKTNISPENLLLSEANDVIIPASGETQIDIATASCVLKSGIALGGDLNIIKSEINGVFLSYYLNNTKKLDIAKLSQGISVVHLYASQLKTLKLNIPLQEEQQKLANFLSIIESRISTQIEIIEHQESLKRGLIQQLFSQQLRFNNHNGNDFPDWEENYGNTLFENISDKKHNSDLPILAITQDKGAIPRDFINYNIGVTTKSVSSYKVVKKGDFIISLRSFQGGVEYSNYTGICSPAYVILRPTKNMSRTFYKYFFKTNAYIIELNKKLEGIRDGKMVSYKYFSEIKLPYPSLEEQVRVANLLSSMDEKIEKEEQLLEQYKQQKKHLLQNLFI